MIDINKILKEKENLHLEVKAAENKLPKNFWESYSAFANTDGGVILLGVKEDTTTKSLQINGVTNPDSIITDIWNTLNNRQKVSSNILIDEQIYKVEFQNKIIIVIEVPRAERCDKPIYIGQNINQGTFRRNNEGDYRCSNSEIKSMLRDQSDKSSDNLILENLDLSSLCNDSIKKYRIIFDNKKPNHVWSSLTTQEFLLKIGAARISQKEGKIHPTLAGLLFFGFYNEILNELPYYFLDYREHLNQDVRWTDRVCSSDSDWSGNIFEFYFKIINKLTSTLKKPFKLDKNLQRVDDTLIHSSIREALANALIHADYYGTRGIVIDKTNECIKISNPGNFRIPIKEAVAGGISDARNSKIFNMFSLIDIGERSGMGLCNLFNVWSQNNLVKPIITETISPVERVTIVLSFVQSKNEQITTQTAQNSLNNIEKEILKQVSQKPNITHKALSLILNIKQTTIRFYIDKLQQKQILTRVGSNRNGYWKINTTV